MTTFQRLRELHAMGGAEWEAAICRAGGALLECLERAEAEAERWKQAAEDEQQKRREGIDLLGDSIIKLKEREAILLAALNSVASDRVGLGPASEASALRRIAQNALLSEEVSAVEREDDRTISELLNRALTAEADAANLRDVLISVPDERDSPEDWVAFMNKCHDALDGNAGKVALEENRFLHRQVEALEGDVIDAQEAHETFVNLLANTLCLSNEDFDTPNRAALCIEKIEDAMVELSVIGAPHRDLHEKTRALRERWSEAAHNAARIRDAAAHFLECWTPDVFADIALIDRAAQALEQEVKRATPPEKEAP